MNLTEIALICKAFRKLGDAVGEQILAVIESPTTDVVLEQNFAALGLADREFLTIIERLAQGGLIEDRDEDLLDAIKEVREAIADAKEEADAEAGMRDCAGDCSRERPCANCATEEADDDR